MKKGAVIILTLLCELNGFAQKPTFGFLSDSIILGERISAYLVFKHNKIDEVFFPNQGSDFGNFEYQETKIFPTETHDTISTDSVIYVLKIFKTDPKQILKLPVWISNGVDSITLWSNEDTVFFKALIPDSLLDNTKLMADDGRYIKEPKEGISDILKHFLAIVAILGLVLLFLQNKIRTWWIIFRLNKRQKEFHKSFVSYMNDYQNHETLNKATVHWRNYLEFLDKKPFASLSAIEIEKLTGNEQVGLALKEVESALFGGKDSDRIPLALQILSRYARERFRLKKVQFKKKRKNG